MNTQPTPSSDPGPASLDGRSQIALYQGPPAPTNQLELAQEDLDLLRETLTQDLDNREFALFVRACRHTGLDPFHKQIHAIKRGGRLTIQTSIDGYRLLADRTGRYAPGREPVFEYDGEGRLATATAFVKKLAGGQWHEVAATAFWSEYCPPRGQDRMWKKMPHLMLAKCAEALALRRAFPAELSGVYTDAEMDQAAADGSISAEPATTAPATGAAPPAPADGPTLKALQARFRELGFTDKHRDERLAFASRILARAVESFKDLSSDERRVTMRVAGYLGKHLPDVLDFASFAEAMGLELSSNQAVRAALAEYASAQAETADG